LVTIPKVVFQSYSRKLKEEAGMKGFPTLFPMETMETNRKQIKEKPVSRFLALRE
jgi:hypothetical protein